MTELLNLLADLVEFLFVGLIASILLAIAQHFRRDINLNEYDDTE